MYQTIPLIEYKHLTFQARPRAKAKVEYTPSGMHAPTFCPADNDA